MSFKCQHCKYIYFIFYFHSESEAQLNGELNLTYSLIISFDFIIFFKLSVDILKNTVCE